MSFTAVWSLFNHLMQRAPSSISSLTPTSLLNPTLPLLSPTPPKKMLSKHLHLCFTGPTTQNSSPSQLEQHHNSTTTTTTPTTSTSTTTASSSSSGLLKTFNSLYDNTPLTPDSTLKSISRTSDEFSTSDSETTDSTTAPDFATIFASQRFFFSSPGRSNSIIESSSSSSSSEGEALVGGGVPTPKYSPDPYMDFRRSMQEMVESRKLSDVTKDWDFLHELLLCYLALNPKHAHKYIIRAFADLLISLMASDEAQAQAQQQPESDISDHCTGSR